MRHPLLGPLLLGALAALQCAEAGEERGDCRQAVQPVTEGFGARGSGTWTTTRFRNPDWPDQWVYTFRPRGADSPVPTILFAPANGISDPKTYNALIEHVVGGRFALIFAPHDIQSPRHADRYAALWDGIADAVDRHTGQLDLERVGLMGHSYGAGALPYLALRALVDEGWGNEGAFLYAMAPWYPQLVTPADLQRLPPQLKALILVFEDDRVTDHRIAIDLFRTLPVPPSEKDYVLIRSDSHDGCELPAVHTVPQSTGLRASDDALDSHGVFRLFDALAAYAFEGREAGRRVALGHGRPEQVAMGVWSDGTPVKPLLSFRDPRPLADESEYLFGISDAEAWARWGTRGD